jgi:hypothetical protein
LKASHSTETEFTVNDEHLIVKSGKSTAKLPYLKEIEFLFEEPNEKWVGWVDLNEDVLKGIEICLSTSSRDQTQEAFMGVCVNFDIPNKGKNPILFSCDGDAITKYIATGSVSGQGAYTIPNAFCEALLKISHETETFKGKLSVNENWARATLDNGFTLYGRMIVNSNPLDHMKLIEQSLNKKPVFTTLPLGLHDALSRARVLADFEKSKTTMTVTGGKLNLFTVTHMGDVKDDLRMKDHPDVVALVHASLVQRSIEHCDEITISDRVTAYRQGNTILQVVSNIGE